jgi:hypothetical protein
LPFASLFEPQQHRDEPEQQQLRCRAGCEAASVPAPPQPQEEPNAGCATIDAANSQESILGSVAVIFITIEAS